MLIPLFCENDRILNKQLPLFLCSSFANNKKYRCQKYCNNRYKTSKIQASVF